LTFSLPAQAATDTLDQFQNGTSGVELAGQMAQTFTAGMTGQLDRVSLATDTSLATFTVQLESVSGTFPAGTAVLGTSSFSGSYLCCRRFHDFYFSPSIGVTAGGHYAIVVLVPGRSHLSWYTSNGADNYAGGSLYVGALGGAWSPEPQHGGDFAFQTWVIGGSATPPNQAPTVAADSSTVNVNEGNAPTMTGTFADTDGDTVALTATAGTITRTGTSGGTWSWTAAASDEPASQAVTVKADDGHGNVATANFTATTTGVAPTVNISRPTAGLSAAVISSGSSFSSPEGTAVTLNGSASSPSAQDNAAGFTYSWTVTKNGATFGAGSAAVFSFTPNDEGMYVATLQATDDGGMTGTSSVTITGANVAPSAKIASISWTPQLVLTTNESVSFAGTFTDPGTLDTHTAGWNFGDGATASGLSATHSYSAAGSYTVTFTVTDDDNGVGQATTTVTIQTPEQALTSIAGYVQSLKSLNNGQKNSLTAKLDAAGASIARGDAGSATNQLDAFLNELQADLTTGRITSDDMTTLRSSIHDVQAALGTYNRFLQWWPLGA